MICRNKIGLILSVVLVISVVIMLPMNVCADTGPKPSVRVKLENMGDELCYGTLLSKEKSTGPYSAWSGEAEDARDYGLDIEIWKAFAEYKDIDGYHFLQTGWQVNENHEFAWTYYPPKKFKVLLYFPESNTFFDKRYMRKICF